jgi:alkanesulfonate monooxygenase SsuD/methylene tetrahydromethanopterin reductase-like flavin-dependent oxidoreductase (luciferase family)
MTARDSSLRRRLAFAGTWYSGDPVRLAREVDAWLAEHPRFVAHYTPVHASWVNQVELFFSILTRRVIRRGNFSFYFPFATSIVLSIILTLILAFFRR